MRCGKTNAEESWDGHNFIVKSHQIYAIVTDRISAEQCLNCFGYFKYDGCEDKDFIDHMEHCTKNVGRGYTNAQMPIYSIVFKGQQTVNC